MKNIIIFTLFLTVFNSKAQIPLNGLIASFPFNGNANDESGFGNDGIVYGAILTEDRFGNPNSAYLFNGVDNYIDLGVNPKLDFLYTEDATFSLWFITKQQLEQRLYSKRDYNNGIEIVPVNDSIFFFIGDNTGKYIFTKSSNIITSDSTWYNLVFTIDQNNKIAKCYIDGIVQKEIDTKALKSGIVNSFPAFVGANTDLNVDLFFNGKIDDFFVYNRLLSESEINQLATGINDGYTIGSNKSIVTIYNMNGVEVQNEPSLQGLFLVKYSDGTTKKVFKQ
jgi:hypothetical protein